MTRILRITLLCLCLLLAYLGTAAAWAGAVFDRLAATPPPAQGMLLSPRQNAILLAVEDPDFATHHGISFADGQGIATITAAVAMGTHAGVQVRGLALAALLYEGKPLAALDDHAFIRLAAMIKAPKRYHPQHHPAALAERAARIDALLAGACKPADWSDTTFDHCRQKAATP
jgi:membrane peptidoglycan carboxypeptidase